MTILSRAHALSPSLPDAWAPALEALARIQELTKGPEEELAQRQAEARALYAQLLEQAWAYREPIPESLSVEAPNFRRWFSEAVLLWMRYAETSSAPLVDTAGTRTLAKFPVDFPVNAGARAAMRRAVQAAFGWSDAEMRELEAKVAHLTSNLDIKLKITACVAQFLEELQGGERDPRLVLMDVLYGELPWRVGDIDWVITGTSIFPCVPRKKDQLLKDDWEERSPEEQAAIGAFMVKLRKANTANTLRFPAFGLAPNRPAEPLWSRLVLACGVSEEVLIETLETMVMIVPTHQVDQYVVHDSWGHTWQEALSEFEWEYARVLELADDLTPHAGPAFGGDVATLGSCLRVENDALEVDEERLLEIAKQDVLGRFGVATSIALSEMLADFMESKFARQVPEEALPTSSLIDVAHLKIDLSLSDIGRQIKRLAKPYRRLATEPEAQQQFADALIADGFLAAHALPAAQRVGTCLWRALEPLLSSELSPAQVGWTANLTPKPDVASGSTEGDAATVGAETVPSTLYRRAMLQLMLIAAELENGLEGQGGDWRDPGSSPDLFLIAITHLYEQDRLVNFWHMDQVMRVAFAPAAERLRIALDAA
ncbi:MAG: hypothetical protein KC766_41790 [Myxococcales bacterium]|nr:hypothetical protein [Myxococcales bacterium]